MTRGGTVRDVAKCQVLARMDQSVFDRLVAVAGAERRSLSSAAALLIEDGLAARDRVTTAAAGVPAMAGQTVIDVPGVGA